MVHLRLVSHDALFHQLKRPPVIANDMDITTEAGRETLKRLLYEEYNGDNLSVVPTCECGATRGGDKLHAECPECGDTCNFPIEKPLTSLIWIRAPHGVKALINPWAWIMLSSAMTKSSFNLLEWFCNPAYKAEGKPHVKLPKLEAWMHINGIERGINFFHDRFDEIMAALYTFRMITEAGPRKDDYKCWIAQNRNKIFSQYVPMPSKVGFVVEKSAASNVMFLDKTITHAVDALHTIVSIDTEVGTRSIHKRQVRASRACAALAEYYTAFVKKLLSGKPGILRKQIYGARVHFSARAVISSIVGPHEYDELHLPWSLALQLLELHITNKLYKRGFTPNQVEALLRVAATQFHPLINEIFNELIRESPWKGIAVTFGRNCKDSLYSMAIH